MLKQAGLACLFGVIGLWLLGCQAPVAEPTSYPILDPICTESGVVEHGSVDETSRGYSYSYFIYLPPCYGTDTEKTYPILYLLPGRGGGSGTWFGAGANEIADEMILAGDVPPFIIVGAEDMGSDMLVEGLYNDLLPYIESHYRVNPERPFQAVAGGSLGSVGAYRLAFQHPHKFAAAGMFGGGLIHGEEPQVEGWLEAMSDEERPRLFLNCGEQDPLMLERANVMVEMLDEYGIEHMEIFSPGEHIYTYWASNFPAYFEWLADGWEQETG